VTSLTGCFSLGEGFLGAQMILIDPVTPQTISSALERSAGLAIPPDLITLERRKWRWIAYLPGELIAWIPVDLAGAERLGREGQLLRFLEGRVSFGLPSVRYVDPDLRLQVRRKIPGFQVGGEGAGAREFGALPQGLRLAGDLGRALGELHLAVPPAQAQELGYGSRRFLPDADELHGRLASKISDQPIAMMFDRLLDIYKRFEPPSRNLVLIHGDVWGGNFAVNPVSGALNGLFDFDDACVADRHLDFMYAHSFGEKFRKASFAAYASTTGIELSGQRTAMYYALSAFAALSDTRNKSEVVEDRIKKWVANVCLGPTAELALGS
jgi:aminoglycoside phosphotransferase